MKYNQKSRNALTRFFNHFQREMYSKEMGSLSEKVKGMGLAIAFLSAAVSLSNAARSKPLLDVNDLSLAAGAFGVFLSYVLPSVTAAIQQTRQDNNHTLS